MVDRPLSVIEKHFASSSSWGCVTLCGCEISGLLSIPILKTCLEAVRRKHPILRSRLTKIGDNDYKWTPSDDPSYYTLAEMNDPRPSSSFREIIQDQMESLSTPIGYFDPQFRFALVYASDSLQTQRCAFMMAFSHVVMDGLSRVSFLSDLLAFAAHFHATNAIDLDSIKSLPPLPSLVELFGSSLAQPPKISPPAPNPLSMAFDDVSITSREQVKQGVLLYRCDASILEKLKAFTKRNSITLNALFMGAAAIAIYRFYGQKETRRIPFGAPVNARSMVDPPVGSEQLGNFAIQADASADIGSEDTILSAARKMRDNLLNDSNERNFFKQFISMCSNPSMNLEGEKAAANVKFPRFILAIISNVGIVDAPKHGPYQLQAMYSGVANRIGHGATFFIGIQTVHNEFNIAFSFPDKLYDRKRIADLTASILDHFTNPEKQP